MAEMHSRAGPPYVSVADEIARNISDPRAAEDLKHLYLALEAVQQQARANKFYASWNASACRVSLGACRRATGYARKSPDSTAASQAQSSSPTRSFGAFRAPIAILSGQV
jgi:hypothetical protein